MVKIDEIMTVLKGLPKDVLLSSYGNENGLGSLCDPSGYTLEKAAATFNLERIEKALQEIPEIFKMTRNFSNSTSYGFKHVLEHVPGNKYISNGDFIVATILSGFTCKFKNSVNCVLNCKIIEKKNKII